MKKVSELIGVTLLEIMLVLAIAAMIIVMSVRYYQSANSAQQSNTILQVVQSIVASANQLSQATGSYTGIDAAKLQTLLGKNGLNTPWGTTISITTAASTIDMTITGTPSPVCPLIVAKLEADDHFKPGNCTDGSATDLTVQYLANP